MTTNYKANETWQSAFEKEVYKDWSKMWWFFPEIIGFQLSNILQEKHLFSKE